MRAFLSAIAFLATLSTAAIAGPKEEALQVLEKWTKAFTEGIRTYFENALLNNRPRSATLGDYVPMTLSDTAVVITGLDTVTGVRDEKPFSAVGRVTFVVAKRGADWQIVHFHRSAMPN